MMFSVHFLFVLSVCVGAAILSPASAAGSYETCMCKEVASPRPGKCYAITNSKTGACYPRLCGPRYECDESQDYQSHYSSGGLLCKKVQLKRRVVPRKDYYSGASQYGSGGGSYCKTVKAYGTLVMPVQQYSYKPVGSDGRSSTSVNRPTLDRTRGSPPSSNQQTSNTPTKAEPSEDESSSKNPEKVGPPTFDSSAEKPGPEQPSFVG